LLVTHDMEIARQAARVIEMKDGRIVADGHNITSPPS
jgi:energy-coupling factor transporter ATP-binding protein EcfA2